MPMETFGWEVQGQPKGRNLVEAQKPGSAYLCMDPTSNPFSGGSESSIDVQLVFLWLSVATSNRGSAHPGGFKKARQLMIFRYCIL